MYSRYTQPSNQKEKNIKKGHDGQKKTREGVLHGKVRGEGANCLCHRQGGGPWALLSKKKKNGVISLKQTTEAKRKRNEENRRPPLTTEHRNRGKLSQSSPHGEKSRPQRKSALKTSQGGEKKKGEGTSQADSKRKREKETFLENLSRPSGEHGKMGDAKKPDAELTRGRRGEHTQ